MKISVKITLPLLFTLSLISLSANELRVSLNGMMRSYTQTDSYDSSTDKTKETDLGYGIKGMYLFDSGIGFYGSASFLSPQTWDITDTDGSVDENDVSSGLDTAMGFGYMLGVVGSISPTEFLDAYLALGYAGTTLTLKNEDSDSSDFEYKLSLKGVGTDFGIKLNIQDPLYVNVGTYLILQLSADEEYTTDSSTESATLSLTDLDIRPYIGLGYSY
jgi:hypothetical protein